MSNSTTSMSLFPAPQNFAPPRDERESSPLHPDKTPFIVCLILLGMIVTAVGAWTVYSYRRRKRDLEKLDEESSSSGGCISKDFDKEREKA